MKQQTKDLFRLMIITVAITSLAILLCGMCTPAKGQVTGKNVFQEVLYQNSDLDMLIVYDFFGINKLSCHLKTSPLIKLQITVQGLILPPTIVYPGLTVAVCNYSLVINKQVTCKYWKYQSPFGTGNTEWKYCGEFQFWVP